MTQWVDFKELRRRLDFAAVLQHYGVTLKVRGQQHQVFCPLPDHPTHPGKKRTPSFSANLARGIWHCFGCGAKGNVLDFAARMEGLNPQNGDELRRAARILEERFGGGSPATAPEKGEAARSVKAKAAASAREPLPVAVNAPLDFELKDLDATHPYLIERGLKPPTVEHFGLG